MLAGEPYAARAVVIGNGGLFPLRSPSAVHGVRNKSKICDGLETIPARAEGAATQEWKNAAIENVAIEIANEHRRGAGAHEAVQGLFEEGCGGVGGYLVSEVAADGAVTSGGVVAVAN